MHPIAAYALKLIVINIVFFAVAWAARKWPPDGPPVSFCFPFLAVIGLVNAFIIFPFLWSAPSIVVLGASLMVAYLPISMIAIPTARASADLFHSFLFDPRNLEPMPTDFSRARALAMKDDINGAINEYWKYFEEDPKKPTALFALTMFLEKEQRYEQAAKYYQEILTRFERNVVIWAEASLRLAAIHADHRFDPQAAEQVLRPVARRARRLPQGRLAAQRLLAFPPSRASSS